VCEREEECVREENCVRASEGESVCERESARERERERMSGLPEPEGARIFRQVGIKVLNLRTTTSQKCEAVPRRARIWGS